MQELLDAQKRFVHSCQQVQQDDPKHVTDVLDKLIDSLIKLYVTHSLFSAHSSPYLCKLLWRQQTLYIIDTRKRWEVDRFRESHIF